MCVHKRYIRNRLGKEILVPCGHCPSCLQAKALSRTNKIRANFPDAGSGSPLVALFVTLTYANDYVPYIRPSEVSESDVLFVGSAKEKYFSGCKVSVSQTTNFSDYLQDGTPYYDVNIYRDRDCRYVRVSHKKSKYKFRKKSRGVTHVISTVPVPVSDWETSVNQLSEIKHKKLPVKDKVSVVYFKDCQDFVKRLRSNLSYRGYEKHISVYQCSEYGPDTCRGHFHLLIFAPLSDYQLLSDCIVQAWPYDDGFRTRKNIEISRNAASYVSSYVNCASFVPPLFFNIKQFRPKASASKGFGLALKCYSLAKVFEAYKRGDLHVDVWRYKQNAFVVERILLPKYVINRYFPKIKGYSRLSIDALQSVCEIPSSLKRYASEFNLDYNDDDFQRNYAILRNAWSRCQDIGLSLGEFADVYSRIWTLRSSQVYRDELESMCCINENFYAYDNIGDYFQGNVVSLSLDDLLTKTDYVPQTIDFNEFPKARQVTARLEDAYYKYNKSKHVRSICYNNFDLHM